MPRLFVAVPVAEAVRNAIAKKVEAWRQATSGWRWVAPHQYHITLKFLGDVLERRVDDVVEAMAKGAADLHPIDLVARGVGAFPHPQKARVFWAGVQGDTESLHRLQARIDEQLELVGFPREGRSFSPHVTVARSRRPAPIPEKWHEDESHVFGGWTVGTVQLIESQLSSQGPHYRVKYEVAL